MTVGMNTAIKLFIDAELAALTANNNIPAAFQTTVTTDSTAFDFKYNAFKLARQTTDETTIKINANNKVFAELTFLNDDAQRVYAKNIAIKKMFVFETVKEINIFRFFSVYNTYYFCTGTGKHPSFIRQNICGCIGFGNDFSWVNNLFDCH